MTLRPISATAAFLAASSTLASPSNDVGFNPVAAGHYCDELASSYQVLDEDRSIYLSRCVAAYRDSPPGDEGSDVSSHAASY